MTHVLDTTHLFDITFANVCDDIPAAALLTPVAAGATHRSAESKHGTAAR